MVEAPAILLIEDDERGYTRTRALLRESFGDQLKLDWVRVWDETHAAIQEEAHDIYLVDYQLGRRDGVDLISAMSKIRFAAPFIVLTDNDCQEVDAEAMKSGAADYLVKSEITAPLLARAIRYAIERKRVERRLTFLAECDTLTGLANRAVFHSRLADAIAQAHRNDSVMAVLLLDLDQFKDVNDTLGHPVGDLLIQQAAKRLSQCTRASDTVARLGGDEFAVVATNLAQTEDITVLARKISEALAEPFDLDGNLISTSASIGNTVYPLDNGDPHQILKHADLALYQAKRTSRGSFHYYDAELNAQAQQRKWLENQMRTALESQQFILYYQPKVNIVGGEVVGAEVLLRWRHPECGMVGPAQFIPIAESTGLIVPLGEWVVREASKQCVAWRRQGLPPIPLAINVSAVQFRRSELVESIAEIIEETQIDPTWLGLEITESMIMDRVDPMMALLHRLHEIGIRLAIDDFGTGHSSLSYLRRFSVDTLKIDRSFVRNVENDADDATIAKAIISLGKSLNLRVIAEGVETERQLDFLREHGCEEAQGFFFSRPVSADDFAGWYRENEHCIGSANRVAILANEIDVSR